MSNLLKVSFPTTALKRSAIKSIRIIILVVLLSAAGLQFLSPPQTVKADVAAGFSEYYIPGEAQQVLAILKNNYSGLSDNLMHNVITIPITTPNLMIYYDHWENGYSTGAAGDEIYSGYAVGTVLTFESPRIPANPRGINLNDCPGSTNPNGTTTACYDGRDRIFVVGGAVSMAQAFWPSLTGTVLANAWEIYPVKVFESSYVMPVGENLFDSPSGLYADFDNVYVLVQATADGTTVSITNPGRTPLPATSLNRGQVTQLYHINTGATVTSNYPVQVQFMVGTQNNTDSRSHTLVPSALWDKQYYSPVPSYSYSSANVNIYMYNPSASTLVVTYQDTLGTLTCNIPAHLTKSTRACFGRSVANGSAVYLSAASNFLAIGEYDTGSSSWNWGFSIIPAKNLNTEYYVPWAPGADVTPPYPNPPQTNGSPVFVTPTVNGQVIYVDYSPTDGIANATYTLNLLQVQKVRDPDNINTGMHLWSDFPFAVTWGEDAQYAQAGTPYIDAGYAILPLNPDWINIVLGLNKSANPEVIANQVGETVDFTIQVNTGAFPINAVYITDLLSAYFQYVPGTTTIAWPGGSSTVEPTITGLPSTGYTLGWGTAPGNITNLDANQALTLKFSATTVTGFNATSSVNNATVTGAWNGIPITATGQATVIAGQPGFIKVIKDAVPDDSQDFAFTLIDQARPTHPLNFILDDDADPTYSNTVQYSLRAGTYSVSEIAVIGWDLTGATCVSSISSKTPTLTNILLDAGETVTCTFTNTKQLLALELTKSASPATYSAVGQTISYSYVMTNTGNITLAGPFSVSDDHIGSPLGTAFTCGTGPLAPLATTSCTETYSITQADLDAGSLTNVASATDGMTTSPTDTVIVPATQSPALSLVKSASPVTYNTAGQTIGYTYELKNTGNVTLSGPFTVDDDQATVTCPDVSSLAVGDSLTCTASHTVTQAEVDSGSITNIAKGHAFFGTAPVDSNQDPETVTAVKNPALTIVKTASPNTYDTLSQAISYSYLVTNSGNVTLYNLTVVDDKAPVVTCPSTSAGLAPLGQITCTASYTITQADLDTGSVTNSAYANDGTTSSMPNSETVNAIQQGGLGLTKSANPATYSAVGQTISYSYVMTNTGNITLAGPFSVSDDHIGSLLGTAFTCGTGPLAPLATTSCTETYSITQADLDAGSLTNIATATDGTLTSNEVQATVSALQTRALAFDKIAQETTFVKAGDVIHYSYLVTNAGNVTLHDPITVSDDKASDESCPALPAGGLAPGASITCSASTTITQADMDAGSLTNVASATDGMTTSPTDMVIVPATQSPALSLVKSASPATYNTAGQTISYTYELKNTGNVTLSGPFTVDDDQVTVTCPDVSSLAVGDSLTCTASRTVTQAEVDSGKVTNLATATATWSGNTVTSNQDTTTVTANQIPALTLVKTASPGNYSRVGDVIGYSYVVKNTGNVTQTKPFYVIDDKLGTFQCGTVDSLAPGASATCIKNYAIAAGDLNTTYNASITNRATATGIFGPNTVTSNQALATINQIAPTGFLLPTQTSCQMYAGGSSMWPPMYSSFNYKVKGDSINSISPGVIFYYNTIKAPSASFTLTVTETNSLLWKAMVWQVSDQAYLYTSGCKKASGVEVTATGTTSPYIITFNVTGATPGATYYIGIKYTPHNVIDQIVSIPYPTNTYSFSTSINGIYQTGSAIGIEMISK